MSPTVENYLEELKQAMQGCDPAQTQDALADAREHFSLALADALAQNPEADQAAALDSIMAQYGSPEETAQAYREIERRTTPSLRQSSAAPAKGFWRSVFGVYYDPRTWGSLLYTLIAFVTGVVYFSWVVTGLSLSLSLLILIIGVPVAILFLLSVQGLALLEGRLVEALLGVRMPRRPAFAQPGIQWLERLKALLADRHTWISMLYMLFQLPLGIIYFCVTVTFGSLSLAFLFAPVARFFVKDASINMGPLPISPLNALLLLPIIGALLLTLTLHLVRAFGSFHGRYAKWLLVD